MAENILSGSDKTNHHAFGLLPGVAIQGATILDCADIINAKAAHAQAVIEAARELLRIDPGYPVDELLESAVYALAAIHDASEALLSL